MRVHRSSLQKELAQSSASSKPKTDQHEDTLEPAEEAAQGDVKMQVQVPEAVLSVANQSDVVSPIVELERLRGARRSAMHTPRAMHSIVVAWSVRTATWQDARVRVPWRTEAVVLTRVWNCGVL